MPKNGERGRPGAEQYDRMFFDDRINERDRRLAEVLDGYDQTAGDLAQDYANGTEWLAYNPLGYNKADFDEATGSIERDATALMRDAAEALEWMITECAGECHGTLRGEDAELYKVLLAHAQRPDVGSMHPSVHEGMRHFTTFEAREAAEAAFDALRVRELKDVQNKDKRGAITAEFSTPMARQAANAILDQVRLRDFFAESVKQGVDTLRLEDMQAMSTEQVAALATVVFDGERFERAKAVQKESKTLGLGNALPAMHINQMSTPAVKAIAFNLLNENFTQRTPNPGDGHRTTWFRKDWNARDPWGVKQQRQQREQRERERAERERQRSWQQSQNSGRRDGYRQSSHGHTGNATGGQRRAQQSSARQEYKQDPNRVPSTEDELRLVQLTLHHVSRLPNARQFGWFKGEPSDVIVDVIRAVNDIRAAKGNEGIRDRKVIAHIRQLSENMHADPAHPSHKHVQILDAMVGGNNGKTAKLPF